LDLRDKNGVRVAFNDNWKDDANQAAQVSAYGLAPADDHEAAIFAVLPAGEYTAIVADKKGNYGTAIVEMYNLAD
jgi:outer membrane PBP1 activator LpoA protein